MTDKELFEKTEKTFKLKKDNKLIENVFKDGFFRKTINEIATPKAPDMSGTAQAAGGFLNRVAAAIPGTRGHKMRSAQARTAAAEAKKAEIEARSMQQKQMQGKSTQTRQYEDWCRKKESQMKLKPLGARDQGMYDKHCTLSPETSPVEPTKPEVETSSAETTKPEVNFKINDTVLVKTKNNPNALGKVTNLLPTQKDKIQVTVKGAPPYAYNIQNVKKYDRVENEESFEQIIKKYR
jgi:hypothetical protein